MGMTLEIGYRNDYEKRQALNDLMGSAFSFTFEPWYKNFLWDDRYKPYSFFSDGKVIANIGVYEMTVVVGQKKYKVIQIGAVTSIPEYRGGHLVTELFDIVFKAYPDIDFAFLYSETDVQAFYPKFGFSPAKAYFTEKEVRHSLKHSFVKVDPDLDQELLFDIIKDGKSASTLSIDNPLSLQLFSLPFYKDDLYIDRSNGILVIMKEKDGTLLIKEAIGLTPFKLEEVAGSLFTEPRKTCLFTFPNTLKNGRLVEDPDHLFIRTEKPFEIENFLVPQLLRT